MAKTIFLVILILIGLLIAVRYWKLFIFLAVILAVISFPIVLPLIGLGLVILLVVYMSEAPQRAEERRRLGQIEEARLLESIKRSEESTKRAEIHRDSDQQDAPYTYQIGRHANEALAIRYGIANQEKKTEPYLYHKKGGVLARNPSRDKVYYAPASTIRLQKTKKIRDSHYEVLLKDFRDRKAIAVIEVGAEYVRTFYPLQEDWFKKHADLERTLKGNGSFSLKELANFHVLKTIGG